MFVLDNKTRNKKNIDSNHILSESYSTILVLKKLMLVKTRKQLYEKKGSTEI